jgi:CHC2 zinc finger
LNRFSPAELDDIKARNPLADVAGGYVKLRRAGGRLVGPCPVCGGKVSAQRFEILDNGESWVCAACPDGGDVIRLVQLVERCDFIAAIERLGGRVAVDPDAAKTMFEAREKKRLAREKTAAGFREAERKRLWRTWEGAVRDLAGTPVEAYAGGRGLQLPARCPGLRYAPSLPYWHGEQIDERGRKSPIKIHSGPAMLGAFIRADGTFGGLHMTWLDREPVPGKVELADPETGEMLKPKKMRGSKTGAHIAIAKLPAPRRLVVGEGIETVLAVWTAHQVAGRDIADTAFWAAGDLGNLAGRARDNERHPTLERPDGRAQSVPGPMPDPDDAGLSIPDSVEELILLGDGDSEPVLTDYAMTRAARRYARQGFGYAEWRKCEHFLNSPWRPVPIRHRAGLRCRHECHVYTNQVYHLHWSEVCRKVRIGQRNAVQNLNSGRIDLATVSLSGCDVRQAERSVEPTRLCREHLHSDEIELKLSGQYPRISEALLCGRGHTLVAPYKSAVVPGENDAAPAEALRGKVKVALFHPLAMARRVASVERESAS